MMRMQRGTALAETALVVGFSLVIIFNGFDLALLGYNQLHADAAAFVGARINAITGSTSIANSAVASALPPTVAPAYTASGNNAIATVTATSPGLLMLPGAAATVGVQGQHLEPVPNSALTAQPFAFAVPGTFLANYFWATSQLTISNRSIYLAQAVDTSGTGNGANGSFAEWSNHESCFAKVNFPNSYATTQDSSAGGTYAIDLTNSTRLNNQWVPASGNKFNSSESSIYGWDAGGANKGKAC